MGELPLDIFEEILVRFKIKDLGRYKSVCKSWNSLISSECFVKSHLNYKLKKKADNNEIGDTRIVLSGPSISDYQCDIVGSSNGLVCVRFRMEFLVVNPSIRQVIKLESPPRILNWLHFRCFGFGYDPSIDDYKVVIRFRNTLTDKYCFLVLALRSNVWRSIAEELDYRYMSIDGVLWKGAIHRLAYNRKNNKIIVSFDLSKEIFKEIPTPQPFNNIVSYKLGTWKDRLCFFCRTSRDYWVMKNYNVQKSDSIWEPILLPPPCNDSPRQAMKPMMDYNPRTSVSGHIHIWMLEGDSTEPVFLQRVISPSGTDHHIWLSTISECNYKFKEHVFVESLVSPHSMSNDNRNCNEGRLKRKRGN